MRRLQGRRSDGFAVSDRAFLHQYLLRRWRRVTLRHDPARYVVPALEGEASFDYTNNDGQLVIGTGERSFTLQFSTAGPGTIYVLSDPSNIRSVAVAPGAKNPADVTDASLYDGSSRVRTVHLGDAAILRNQSNYWAAVFVDEVLTRESSSNGESRIKFRYLIPAVPTPILGSSSTGSEVA